MERPGSVGRSIHFMRRDDEASGTFRGVEARPRLLSPVVSTGSRDALPIACSSILAFESPPSSLCRPRRARLCLQTQRHVTPRTSSSIRGLRSGPREAQLTDGRLSGPTIEVSAVGPDHFAGYSGRTRIDLRLDAGRIEGVVANLPTSLSISSDASSLRLAGRYAGVASVLDLTPTAIRGNMGLCVYELTRAMSSSTYTGTVCGTPRSDLMVPANLDARGPAERAVMVAVFLGTQNSVTQQFD